MDDSESLAMNVKKTADDALLGKLSAVKAGYYSDPFLQCFLGHSHHDREESQRHRPPLINRGNFARVACVQALIESFLGVAGERAQVVSLGAGKDTTFFRLAASSQVPLGGYYEIDFPSVMRDKARTIKRSKPLRDLCPSDDMDVAEQASRLSFSTPSQTHLSLADGKYHLLAADLSDTACVGKVLTDAGIDTTAPTLLLAECVLVYLEPVASSRLLHWASQTFQEAVFVSYDMIGFGDKYGKMMFNNLLVEIHHPTTSSSSHNDIPFTMHASDELAHDIPHAYPTVESQRERYLQAGWGGAKVCDMLMAYDLLVASGERTRVSKVEILDELEEWCLIMSHYCLLVAANGPHSLQFLGSLPI